MYVESKVELNLPKSLILNLIREPGSLNKYHPFCKKNDILIVISSSGKSKNIVAAIVALVIARAPCAM